MKLDELTPGLYKIRLAEYTPIGLRKKRTSIHLLRVEGSGTKCKCYLDHDTLGEHPSKVSYLSEYEILGKYDGPPQVNRPSISISFFDNDGSEIQLTMHDFWQVRNMLDAMPWLKKPLGFTPRKNIP